MKNFSFDLNCKVSIYVPSTVDINTVTDNTEVTKEVMKRMSLLFGGATVETKQGAWICENGELVTESINVVYSFCTSEQYDKYFHDMIKLAKDICIAMNQEAVTFETVDETGKIGVKFIDQSTEV